MPEAPVSAQPSPALSSTPAQSAPAAAQKPAGAPTSAPIVAGKASNPARAAVSEKLKAAANLNADGSKNAPEQKTAPAQPEAKKTDAKPQAQDKPTDVPKPDEIKADVGDEAAKGPVDAASKEDDKKLGPWQLKAKWEKTAKALEAENADLRKKAAALADLDSYKKRAEQAETKLKEMDDELRFLDYSKSEEFKTKYQQPYEDAWAKAASDLREIRVVDGETERAATTQDLLRLANLPLGEARKLANEMFGDLADEVMSHRRVVRELAEKQNKALEDAKKNGAERIRTIEQQRRELTESNVKLWREFNQQDEAEREFLKPKEGDEEWNTKVTSSKEFVDKAMASNAYDLNLSPEQRAKIIRDQASIRGRAIGFSMLKLENTRLRTEIESLKKTISEYKGAEPTPGEGQSNAPQGVSPANRLDSIHAKIRSMARRTM